MTDDRKELEALRLGIARLGMAAGLTAQIPGLKATEPEPGLIELLESVKTQERGWNKLLAGILGVIQEAKATSDYVVALENDNGQLAIDLKRANEALKKSGPR